MKLSVPIIATLMAAFANTMATADTSAASVSASKSGKSGGDGYGDGEGAFCELYRISIADTMVTQLCFSSSRIFGNSVMGGGGEEVDYDPTMMTLTFDQIEILSRNFIVFDEVDVETIVMSDGVMGDEPDDAIDYQ